MLDYAEEDLNDKDEFGIHPDLPDEEAENHVQTTSTSLPHDPGDAEDTSWIPDGFDFAVLLPAPENHEGVNGV
jgi:hypothetical protein